MDVKYPNQGTNSSREEQGKRLKQAREALGVNQKDAADKLSISKSGLSEIENGRNKLSTEMGSKIAQVFNINVSWVLTGEGEMFLNRSNAIVDAFKTHLQQFEALKRHYIDMVSRVQGKSKEEIAKELADIEEYLRGYVERVNETRQ